MPSDRYDAGKGNLLLTRHRTAARTMKLDPVAVAAEDAEWMEAAVAYFVGFNERDLDTG